MKKRLVKDIIYFFIGLAIVIICIAVIFDACMETSFRHFNIEGDGFWQKYKFYSHWSDCLEDKNFCNKYKQDCKERNGIWQEDKMYCKLKD